MLRKHEKQSYSPHFSILKMDPDIQYSTIRMKIQYCGYILYISHQSHGKYRHYNYIPLQS